MFRKLLLATALGCALTIGASAADVFVRIGPPRPLVERRGASGLIEDPEQLRARPLDGVAEDPFEHRAEQ